MRYLNPLTLATSLAVLMAAGIGQAAAQSYGADPIYNSPIFNFEGFYAGVQAGAATVPVPGFVGTIGAVAGANFTLSEAFLAGLEFQAEGIYNGTGFVGMNALLLGHVGGYITQDIMAYGAVGGGLVAGVGSYAFGVGLEMPVFDKVSGRAEVLGTGTWGVAPNGVKATAGLLWHMN